MHFEGRTFVDQDVLLDGNTYVGCVFRRVNLVYSAIRQPGLKGNTLDECTWALEGPAADTVNFLSGIYNGMGEAGQQIVETTFDNIRKGGGALDRPSPVAYKPTIFIGHGRSADYVLLKDFLQSRGYTVETFESSPRAGQSVKDVIVSMIDRASMAFLVHTAEDERDGTVNRARENVVHETGLFQGRLGYERAIVMREEGCAPFSNLDGIQYIPYPPAGIRASFMDVLDTIEREFPDAAWKADQGAAQG